MSQRILTSLLLFLLIAIAASAEIPITGRVFGADAKPMTRAEVTLEPILGSYDRARLRLDGLAGAEPVVRSRPDAGGIFEIAAPEIGMWKVVVSAPGHLRMELRLVPLVAAEHLPVLKLRRTTNLEVRLADADGNPRFGRVGIFTTNVRGRLWRPSLRLATAGADGIAHLPRAAAEELRLEALAPGFPMVTADVGAGDDSVRLELPSGVAGTVRFTDHRQRPLPGALAYQGGGLVPLGMSDAEGRLSVVLAVIEPPKLRASTADLWTGAFDLDLADDDSDADAETVKDLELKPPLILRGSVLDLSNRDPVPGALVWAARGQAAVTDARGRYELAHGGDSPRVLQAAATKYQRGYSDVRSPGEGPAIALAPAVGLNGRVVDAEGHYLPGVEIEVTVLPQSGGYNASGFGGGDRWIGETSRRGTFQVSGLSAGIGYQMVFEKPGYAPARLEVPPLEAFSIRSGLDVVMDAGRVGIGRVVDEDEVPIAGAEVALVRAVSGDPMLARVRRMARTRLAPDDPGARTHSTDAEGGFEIADLGAGRYDLEVRASGYAPARVPGLRVEEGVGEIDFGTVVLVPGVSIAGRVTDPDGTAIAEAEVVARTAANPLAFSGSVEPVNKKMSDSDGRFVIGELAAGKVLSLSVSKKGYGAVTVSSIRAPTDEPLTVVLRPAGRLSGRVVDRQGSAVENASVMAMPESGLGMMHRDGRPPRARSGTDGRFVLEDVDPGPLRVTVRASTFQTKAVAGVEVVPGEEREIEVVLDAGTVVDGRVTAADGDPVVRASITFTSQDQGQFGGFGGSARTDADGRFHVDDAPSGPVFVSVSNGSRELLKQPLELKPGANTVDLVLEDGFAVSGTVFAPDGSPIGSAGLSIHKVQQPGVAMMSFGPSQTLSSADGTFTLTDVTAGRYRITASLRGYAQASTEAFEVTADVAGLVLELRRGVTLKGSVLGLELDELASLTLAAYHLEGGGMRHGQVDFASQYSIDGLTPGNWHVQAQVASSNRMQAVQIEIPEGVTEVEKDIEFGTGFTLTGIVLDGGEPLPGATVVAAGSMSGMGQAVTDSTGRFRIDHLPAGSYQVMVMSFQSLMRHTEALVLDADHEIRIELFSGRITGRLFDDADGTPVSGASVSIERIDVAGAEAALSRQLHSNVQVSSDSQGSF
ncbi:MAG: carboxypeptidase regulatory-like domain-containing protein, partial [Thermoanaerobaculia bacterium]